MPTMDSRLDASIVLERLAKDVTCQDYFGRGQPSILDHPEFACHRFNLRVTCKSLANDLSMKSKHEQAIAGTR